MIVLPNGGDPDERLVTDRYIGIFVVEAEF